MSFTLLAMDALRLYKFREVGKDWATDYALDALFSSSAIFSGRKNFNDLFDSAIEIRWPTPEEVLALLNDPRMGAYANVDKVRTWVSDGAFTEAGLQALTAIEASVNSKIDRYPIYCLSTHNDCHLLWAHYSKAHTGFCIEFEFPDTHPKPVGYQEHIETIPLLECLKSAFGLLNAAVEADLGNRIHDALLVKMNCWAYEGEYRWIAGDDMGQVPSGETFIKRTYPSHWVKGIIFGCRTPSDLKRYIIQHLPFGTNLKQAIEATHRIEIVPFDEYTHLMDK